MNQPTPPAVDTDELPPTQYLILEVLAARHRLGETLWTFPTRLRSHISQLADCGLIGWKSGVTEGTIRAWLTDTGRAAALHPTYTPPAGGDSHTEYGVRLYLDAQIVDEEPAVSRERAQARIDAHAARRAEPPGWRGHAVLIERTVAVSPWTEAPTEEPQP